MNRIAAILTVISGVIMLMLSIDMLPYLSLTSLLVTRCNYMPERSCPLRCDLLTSNSSSSIDTSTVLAECRQSLVYWIDNNPPSTYQYYDEFLTHVLLTREQCIEPFIEKGSPRISREAYDISALINAIFLRGQPYPTLESAIARDIIDLQDLSDPDIAAIISALNYNQYFFETLLLKSNPDKPAEQIRGEIIKRRGLLEQNLKEVSSSFMFLNSIFQAEMSLLYLSFNDDFLPLDQKLKEVSTALLRADDVLFQAWNRDNIQPFLSDPFDTASSRLQIGYYSASHKVEKSYISLKRIGPHTQFAKMKVYFNNRLEVLTWKKYIANLAFRGRTRISVLNRDIDLTDEQIKRYIKDLPEMSLVRPDLIAAYLTVAEYYTATYNETKQMGSLDLAEKYLNEALSIQSNDETTYEDEKENFNYIKRSPFLSSHFLIRDKKIVRWN